jgi:hypothetical protein
MKYSYRISIRVGTELQNEVQSILGIPFKMGKYAMDYRIEKEVDKGYYDFIKVFMDILEPHLQKLFEIGLKTDSISIWALYRLSENNDINLEYNPESLKRLGDNGISLCISCY